MTVSSDGYEQADVYRGLRAQVLGLDAKTLEPQNGILALLMETGYDKAAATVLATSDGSTSIYFSNGGGIIGAGEYEQVQQVALETLSEAAKHRDQLDQVEAYPLPQKGQTRFYLVTEAGVLTAVAPEEQLGNDKHSLSPLFHQVHKLIGYIRAAEDQRRNQGDDQAK